MKIRIFFGLLLVCAQALANAPYITDDAEPADYHQLQIYPFISISSQPHNTVIYAPNLQFDYGIFPRTELHIIFSLNTYIPEPGIPALKYKASGIGDTELGLKYRFNDEMTYLPKIAFAPAFELPTGDVTRMIGNGRLWTKWPIWLEKHFGTWLSTGGIGYALNSAPGMKNYLFGGFMLQKNLSERLSLGGEIFIQGAIANHASPPFQDDGAVKLLNLGATYNFNSNSNFSVSLGHSINGVPQWVFYSGFYFGLFI